MTGNKKMTMVNTPNSKAAMDTDPTQIKHAPKRGRQALTCSCLSVLITLFVCVGVLFVFQNILPQSQAGNAADSYLNSVKANNHIQSWAFSKRTMTGWTGDGFSGGDEADFSGEVIYVDGQPGTITMILRNDGFMNFLSANWRVIKVDFGSTPNLIPTP